MTRLTQTVALFLGVAAPAAANWNPAAGEWSKSKTTDLRIVTWNVKNGICSSNDKNEGLNNWTALARIVASLRPDMLVLQEAGDNSGNGTGTGVDSVDDLAKTIGLFFDGGSDPFNGHTKVTAFVGKYAPGYTLPFIFVSDEDDGFNRNVVINRYPFVDLNGDTRSRLGNILLAADGYAPGGDGGIRGVQFAEIDLPDDTYRGDLVLGNAHLKAGFDSSDWWERLEAAKNIAYFIDYWFNGADVGIPDPNGAIMLTPSATVILDQRTPVIIGGDWNEDEATNGRRGPAEWLCEAEFAGAVDGTDRDRSDSTYDAAVHPFTGGRGTYSSGAKLDYIAWQDSIVTLRRAFIFNTADTPYSALAQELDGFPLPAGASDIASDHRPVVVDLILPLFGDFDGDGGVGAGDAEIFEACLTGPDGGSVDDACEAGDFDGDGDIDCGDWDAFARAWTEAGMPHTPVKCGGDVAGACCVDSSCYDNVTDTICGLYGGIYHGAGTDCRIVLCPPPPVGACCMEEVCLHGITEATCADLGGTYQGNESHCALVVCPNPFVALIITEIMYNPDSDEGFPNDVEWAEIYNAGIADVDISGWFLQDEDGLTGTLGPGTTLHAGQSAVLIPHDQSIEGFQAAWGEQDSIHRLYAWGSGGMHGLSNSPSDTNEILTLRNADGGLQDEVNYDDADDWPSDSPDGASIYLLSGAMSAARNDDGTNWARSAVEVDGAHVNIATEEFNGIDVGSPGYVPAETPECVLDGNCNDGDICTFDQCIGGLCESTAWVFGDLDHNGAVNLFDVLCVIRGIGGRFDCGGFSDVDVAPCESDGVIDLADVLAVLNAIGGHNDCGCPGGVK